MFVQISNSTIAQTLALNDSIALGRQDIGKAFDFDNAPFKLTYKGAAIDLDKTPLQQGIVKDQQLTISDAHQLEIVEIMDAAPAGFTLWNDFGQVKLFDEIAVARKLGDTIFLDIGSADLSHKAISQIKFSINVKRFDGMKLALVHDIDGNIKLYYK